MKFVPNSEIKNLMLKELGLMYIDELFSDIPKKIRIDDLELPEGLTQQKTEEKIRKIANKNKSCYELLTFLGGGVKPHYIPAAVKSMVSRAEFFTAYTPYQSEASQGFLQAMFEYQSMIADLTGMDVANCSLYDDVTALSEAALMCSRISKKSKFVIPHNISWEKKCVLRSYSTGPGIKINEVDYDKTNGRINVSKLKKVVDKDTAGVYVENPNFFGVFEEDIEDICEFVKDAGSLLVVGIDPISLGIVKSPGDYGADIVIGEGRALGNPMDFGGSSLGIFTCRKDFLRQMPGRVIGLTTDKDSKRAFCMSLQTREQHIRRAKATSNICTNEGLCALKATVFLSWLGGNGLKNLARINFEKGQKLAEEIDSIENFEKMFSGSHFNEFVIQYTNDVHKLNKRLLSHKIQGGLILKEQFPELNNSMLFGVTELHSDEDIEQLISALKEVA